MERHMELLSPAGNREALSAAIACGADAVYLGLTSFGARSYAGNFDGEGLMEAVRYAHERERRVYVTVNTLVLDREMTQLRDALTLIRDAGRMPSWCRTWAWQPSLPVSSRNFCCMPAHR